MVLDFLRKCEKSSFPRQEVFDFECELRKRNVEIVVFVDDKTSARDPPFIAYLVFVHIKAGNTVMLHKICVEEKHRSQGRGYQALTWVIDSLRKRGKLTIQLWVDEHNHVAQRLYNNAGFEKVREVEDYYGPDRNGVNMKLTL